MFLPELSAPLATVLTIAAPNTVIAVPIHCFLVTGTPATRAEKMTLKIKVAEDKGAKMAGEIKLRAKIDPVNWDNVYNENPINFLIFWGEKEKG